MSIQQNLYNSANYYLEYDKNGWRDGPISYSIKSCIENREITFSINYGYLKIIYNKYCKVSSIIYRPLILKDNLKNYIKVSDLYYTEEKTGNILMVNNIDGKKCKKVTQFEFDKWNYK